MVHSIRLAGLDMTMTNLGAARFRYDVGEGILVWEDSFLLSTEPGNKKLIRSNSDDLRRSQEIMAGVRRICAGCDFICAEIPSGSQNAGAAKSFGIAIGILASLPPEKLIQVMPLETKLATVGSATAKKPEMVAWAAGLYPGAPWRRAERNSKLKKVGDLTDENEHMADACAVVHAGIRTDEFGRMMRLLGTFAGKMSENSSR